MPTPSQNQTRRVRPYFARKLRISKLAFRRLVILPARRMARASTATYSALRTKAASAPQRARLLWLQAERHAALLNLYIRPSIQRYGGRATVAFLLFLIVITAAIEPTIQAALGPYFDMERFSTLRNLLATMGGALVGATTIGFSIVTIALQLNFARMPHGLFRKLSSDSRLLAAFAATFVLALIVSTLALAPDASWAAVMVTGAIWAAVLILILFFYAYRRALALINPAVQLRLIATDAQKDLRRWARRAERMAPLLNADNRRDRSRADHDLSRVVFFQANPQWTSLSRKAIAYAIAFARRYSEQGDYDVTGSALTVIIAVNVEYVSAKGKTFFASNPVFDVPQARDAFINETLEHLRQLAQFANARRDEQSLRQVFAAIAGLARTYMAIDFGRHHTDINHHAHLANGYLAGAVEAVLQHGMPDVVMEGMRLLGTVTQSFLAAGQPSGVVTAADKITAFACAGAIKPEFRAVTLIGMEQLARITFDLLRTPAHDLGFAVKRVRDNVELVVRMFLNVPDPPLSNVHSAHLAPYYSSTQLETLGSWLTNLCNALISAETSDDKTGSLIRHLRTWAEELYRTEKTLLLLAIEKRSHFTFDMLHWIAHVTKVLVAVAKASVTNDHDRRELEKHASWLISVISWIPGDKESIAFVEHFSTTQLLFEVALETASRQSEEVAERARFVLLDWTFKAGRHTTGWGTLQAGLLGLAAFAAWKDDSQLISWLKSQINERLSKEDAPDLEIRNRTARNIRRKAAFLRREEFEFDSIDRTLGELDRAKVRALLNEIADILSADAESAMAGDGTASPK
ncbi:MAG: hypothetical protein QOF41_2110 [Methylobacteriaceae bacterium]|nr:hypothetical protein [Methylobacteriaceae bacterium]